MAITKTVNVETTNARASTTLTDTTPTVPLPDIPQGLMVIGPQVTLHFVEGAWNKANSYDYYDVVQVDGTSYIAVQDVPANTEITNTTYWAKWNDPNAQVELLQGTVNTFDSRIKKAETDASNAVTAANQKAPINHQSKDTTYGVGDAAHYGHVKVSGAYTNGTSVDTALSNAGAVNMYKELKNDLSNVRNRVFNSCLIIGDSWMRGYYTGTDHPTQTPGYIAAIDLGVPAGNIHNASVDASGFVTGTTFLQQYNASSNKDDELIIIMGGQNDTGATDATAATAVERLLTAIASGSPNSEVHIFNTPEAFGGRLGKDINSNNPSGVMYMQAAVAQGHRIAPANVTIHNGCHRWGDMFGETMSESDKVHLTQAGYAACGHLMANMIRQGMQDYWPVFVGTILNTQIVGGTINRNFVREENGIVQLCLIWDFTGASGVTSGSRIGTLPAFAQRSFDSFSTGQTTGTTGPTDCFVSYGTDVSLQNTNNDLNWLFLTFTYQAGL